MADEHPSRQSSSSFQQMQASPPQQATRPRRQRPDTEEIRKVGRIHYQELLSYLRSHLAKDQLGPRSNAREKLTRLSKQQFTELSTDVYDELMRRVHNTKDPPTMPHLAVRDEFHPKRNQARQKLSTLPKTRFKDLSSDVFFELERRFPELKEEFRPDAILREREAARRKEQEEQAAADAAAAPQSSTANGAAIAPQESTSDVIIPAKSTLVEEDISVPYKNGSHNNARGQGRDAQTSDDHADEMPDNRSTMYSQASSVGTGFFNGYSGSRGAGSESIASPNLGGRMSQGQFDGPNAFGIEKLRSDYEFRIATLNQRISALEAHNAELKEHASKSTEHERFLREAQEERDQLRADHAEELRSARNDVAQHRDQLEQTQGSLADSQRQVNSLREELERMMVSGSADDIDKLQDELAQQNQIIGELRGEVESLVQEISQLSSRNEELVSEKDQDLLVISDLNQQVQSFKRKYEQAKTELRQYKATSQLFVSPPKAAEFMVPSDTGAVADVNVTAFQTSIDELLAAARSTTPSSVIVAMKSVVLATTLVTDDVAKFEQSAPSTLSADEVEQLAQLKPRISTSLNNLMTACRNHASSQGMSPLSLLDAAASHVATTVVELVKLVKLRTASAAEKEQFEAHFSGNALPAGGLKPLHIGSAATQASSRAASLAPMSPVDQSGEFKGPGSVPSLTSAADAARLSPRSVKTGHNVGAVHGRYSPVGYRPNVNRKDSAGDWSWKAGRGRAMSSSSATSSSINGGNGASGIALGSEPVPALPRTDLSTVKHQWGSLSSPPRRSVSTSSSAQGGSNGTRQAKGNSASLEISPSGSTSFVGAAQPPPSLGDDSSEENWAELRNYIEVQTEAIVHSIQALLSAIREGAQGVQLNENLVQITTIASSIVVISKENLPDSSRAEGEEILAELQQNCDKLSEMQTRPQFDKATKSAMASASYGVAKGLKALNGLLNSVDGITTSPAESGAPSTSGAKGAAQSAQTHSTHFSNDQYSQHEDDLGEYDDLR